MTERILGVVLSSHSHHFHHSFSTECRHVRCH
jgi:hypothetical protein